jgi:hypothetical protein
MEETPMNELATELANLGKAELDIAEGEARITRQQMIIDAQREIGEPVLKAEDLLQSLETTLAAWRDHRQQILGRIAYLEARR